MERIYTVTENFMKKLYQDGYASVAYTDYIEGEAVNEGVEDFTAGRWRKSSVRRAVYIPTGEKDRGGHQKWGQMMAVTGNSTIAIRHYVQSQLPTTKFSIRQY